MLTAVVTTPPVQRGGHLLGGHHAGAVLGLLGGGAQVRSDHDVLALQDRMGGEGLLREHVQGGARDAAALESRQQRVQVHQLPAGAVDDPNPLAHRRDRVRVDEAGGLGGLGQVEGDEVGPLVELLGVSAPSTPSSRKRSAVTNLS